MVSFTKALGFVELKVGTIDVKVPVCAAADTERAVENEARVVSELAEFQVSGNNYAIVLHGRAEPEVVELAVKRAAEEALKHLSRKLLN